MSKNDALIGEARGGTGREAEGVGAAAGVPDPVDGRVAAVEVVAGFAVEGIGAEAAREPVVARPAAEGVVADPAVEAITAFAAEEAVVAALAVDGVVAAFTVDGRDAARHPDHVVTGGADDLRCRRFPGLPRRSARRRPTGRRCEQDEKESERGPRRSLGFASLV